MGTREACVVAVAWPGKPPRLWFDTQTGRLVRVEYTIGRMVEKMDFGDYRGIGGLIVPFRLRESGSENFSVECREVRRNEPIDDSRFTRPATQP